MMKIDVALATFNGAAYLDAFLDSLDRQDYADVSLVVADDGSTDRTIELLRRRSGPSAKIFPNEGDKGVIGNFNTALTLTAADHVALADQDDVWLPGKLSRLSSLLSALEGQKLGPALVFSDLNVVDRDLEIIHRSFFASGHKSINACHLQDFIVSNHIPGCSMMVNRSLLDLALPIPSAVMMHDWWLALVAVTFGIVGRIEEPLVLYRQHGGNTLGAQAGTGSVAKWIERLRAPRDRIIDYRRQSQAARRTLVAFRDRYDEIMPDEAQHIFTAILDGGPIAKLRTLAGAHTGENRLRGLIQGALI
ncbi:glycosyltransferase family 2 protein [Sphingomonas sp. 1P08PE]|uniref:glycosyltransferase family 2 protein n=1 Tax=Sphingomonas sp. 1P08PE TaxID=554122 RepID=UPI00399F4804